MKSAAEELEQGCFGIADSPLLEARGCSLREGFRSLSLLDSRLTTRDSRSPLRRAGLDGAVLSDAVEDSWRLTAFTGDALGLGAGGAALSTAKGNERQDSLRDRLDGVNELTLYAVYAMHANAPPIHMCTRAPSDVTEIPTTAEALLHTPRQAVGVRFTHRHGFEKYAGSLAGAQARKSVQVLTVTSVHHLLDHASVQSHVARGASRTSHHGLVSSVQHSELRSQTLLHHLAPQAQVLVLLRKK